MSTRMGIIALFLSLTNCYALDYDPEPFVKGQEQMREDQKPIVTITLPAPNATVTNDVRLVAVAADFNQTNISADIVWVMNEAPFKTGSDITHTFELGMHTVTARVSDSMGRIGVADISFEVVE